MLFRKLSEYFAELEVTPLRNKMTEILSRLFKEAQASEIGNLCYLLQGRVAPLFTAVEFGLGDKMMLRAVAQVLDTKLSIVEQIFKKEGDLGITVERIKNEESGIKKKSKEFQINEVYEILYNIATAGGTGSQEVKLRLLGDLLRDVDPLSSRYIVRITLAKLRLGFSDMTILDSLSWMLTGSKTHRVIIEKAYNVRPDLGFISETLKKEGIEGLEHAKPKVGTPILMARAERMTNGEDIILKIGKCAIEPKYDGFRLQIHYKKSKIQNPNDKSNPKSKNPKINDIGKKDFIRLFTRNLEDVTFMYPDIVKGIESQIKADEVILEGEAIGINLTTGEYLPFQETVQRKRKYDIEAKAKEIPLTLFAFDCLYINGKSLLHETYVNRRKILISLFHNGETIKVADEEITDNGKRIEEIFLDATTRGLEGVMAKKLDGTYRAGARDFNWIKYKESYASKLSDTIDAVVMGFDLGQGKRTGFGIGDFLIGVLDKKRDIFTTVAKIGTGLTDEEWRELKLKIKDEKLKIDKKPDNYDVDKMMSCDVWITPAIVVEIRADEITRSPVHTAGRIMGPSKSGTAEEVKVAGLALRFPRLERFRPDKNPVDCTTLQELERIYSIQIKK